MAVEDRLLCPDLVVGNEDSWPGTGQAALLIRVHVALFQERQERADAALVPMRPTPWLTRGSASAESPLRLLS